MLSTKCSYKTPPSFTSCHCARGRGRWDSAIRSLQNMSGIPKSPEEAVSQAASATKAAWKDGISAQRIELLIPIIGATELDDWPGGIRQMFTAILPMVENYLKSVKSIDELQGRLDARIIDDADVVAAWTGDNISAIVFPTASSLHKVRALFKDKKLCVLINSQWRNGQVISDFGFGKQKKENEDFILQFKWIYCIKQYRIKGNDIKILCRYPEGWKVFLGDGGNEVLIAVKEDEPSYKDLEEIIQVHLKNPTSLMDRIKQEFQFNIDSIKDMQN